MYVLVNIDKIKPSMVLQLKPQEMVFGLLAELFAHAALRVLYFVQFNRYMVLVVRN